jgi:hypothetical protein
MTTYESALSELSIRLIGTDSNLTNSLSDILAAALQELIEAELTATIGATLRHRRTVRIAMSGKGTTRTPITASVRTASAAAYRVLLSNPRHQWRAQPQ